jgi:hypothetical protein
MEIEISATRGAPTDRNLGGTKFIAAVERDAYDQYLHARGEAPCRRLRKTEKGPSAQMPFMPFWVA